MSLVAQAKADIETITTNLNDWAVEMALINAAGATINIKGIHTKIHLGVDTEGNAVESKQVHVSFSEKTVTDLGYSIRNAGGEVDMKNWRLNVQDSTGVVKNYVMLRWFADETIGLMSCMFEDYTNG